MDIILGRGGEISRGEDLRSVEFKISLMDLRMIWAFTQSKIDGLIDVPTRNI